MSSSWSPSLVRRAAQRPAELVEHPAHALSLVGRQLLREGGRDDGCQPSAHVDAATFRPRSSRRGRWASAGGSTHVARGAKISRKCSGDSSPRWSPASPPSMRTSSAPSCCKSIAEQRQKPTRSRHSKVRDQRRHEYVFWVTRSKNPRGSAPLGTRTQRPRTQSGLRRAAAEVDLGAAYYMPHFVGNETKTWSLS